ncbi:MAG: type IV-A pilus assembly ATPase PilB [Sandaracinaceae bacterium]|nr:type IV-A pilus assembly ATPase PilB [Sandaracinaceae bacterium]MBK7153622.1 type IV-A pilus assembly ATPase PilB [Sandaracinaceae bacterium]
MSNRLGELLVREKRISLEQLRTAQETQRRDKVSLGYALARQGVISDDEITEFLSAQYRVQSIDLSNYEIDPDVMKLISHEVCLRHKVVPVSRAGSALIVAMVDPSNLHAIDDIKFLTGYNVEPVVASEAAILAKLETGNAAPEISYDDIMDGFDEEDIDFTGTEEDVNIMDLERASGDAPVVRLCNAILLNAIKKGASDIHIEPYEKSLRVRYRIDGVLSEEMRPPLKMKNAISSRIKIMSSLDIAERRLPQDGRIKLKMGKGREMDFRVSVLPTLFGEKIVMRLLDKSNLQLDMTKLGFDPEPLKDFKDNIHRPYGMVLVTGPTGSGKTTTLYSALAELNTIDTNISTAEDPVEFNLAGINQVNMHDDIGLNFAASLRSFLRQDPDIIMVGEIRDFETAEIAIKAALTGHMVLSTLHTNDAPSTVTRLLNMGVEPFLVTASVNLVVAQRLARRICADCKQPTTYTDQAMLDVGFKQAELKDLKLMKGTGCATCGDTGYKGRVALYEVMPFRDQLKELVLQGCSTAELKQEMIRIGITSLRMAGLAKVRAGMTTVEEVLRCTTSDTN